MPCASFVLFAFNLEREMSKSYRKLSKQTIKLDYGTDYKHKLNRNRNRRGAAANMQIEGVGEVGVLPALIAVNLINKWPYETRVSLTVFS